MSTNSSKFFIVAKTICVWYFCQIMASIVNKKILTNASENVLPMTLSFLNLLVAAVLDLVCLQYFFPSDAGVQNLAKNIRGKIHIMYPMVLSMILSKYFSLLAYSLISIALMQTIKATSPFALVVLSKLWLNKVYPLNVYLSLIPILAGAMLAASGDYEFNVIGAAAASFATCLGAYNRLYIKRHILVTGSSSSSQAENFKGPQPLDSLKTTVLGHFELAACATLLVFPISLVQEMLYYGQHSFPFGKIVLGASLQWAASLCAWQGLALLEPLSQNVAKIIQRLCSIIVSIIVFHKQVGTQNALGMLVAFFGVGAYSFIYGREKARLDPGKHDEDLPR